MGTGLPEKRVYDEPCSDTSDSTSRNALPGIHAGNAPIGSSDVITGSAGTSRYGRPTRSTAAQLVQRVILNGVLDLEPEDKGVTIADAVTQFFAEQEGRGAALSTLKSFRKFLSGAPGRAKCKDPERFSPTLLSFAAAAGIEYLSECDADFVARFRQAWKVGKAHVRKTDGALTEFLLVSRGAKVDRRESSRDA